MKPMKPTEPALLLVSTRGVGMTVLSTSTQLKELEEVFKNLPLECRKQFFVHFDDVMLATVDLAKLGQLFAIVLQMHHGAYLISQNISSHMGKLQELHIDEAAMNNHRFARLFSALPYARSVHTIQLSSNEDSVETWKLSALELSWIAYAIFHPESSKKSSWRKLMFCDCELAREAEDVLESMQAASCQELRPSGGGTAANALGNSDQVPIPSFLSVSKLAALMGVNRYKRKRKARTTELPFHQEESGVTGMRVARIKASTVVKARFDDGASPLLTLTSDRELEICDFQFESWLCVLVPGFGFGWIHEQNIVETRNLIPPCDFRVSPSLTAFGLDASFSYALAVRFLSAVKNSLESLYFDPAEMSSEILDDVSELCPSLKSLAIAVNGSRELSGASLKRFFSRSSTCSLKCFTAGWQTCRPSVLIEILANASNLYRAVGSLEVLHIRFVFGWEFGEYVAQIEAMLKSNQVLEQVYLSGSTPPEEARELEDLWNGRLVSRERTRNYRLGFLSVLAHDSTKYPALSPDLITLIFGFVWDRRIVKMAHPPWEINF